MALEFEEDALLRRAAAGLVGNGTEIRVRERRLIVGRKSGGPQVDLAATMRLLEGVAAGQRPPPSEEAPDA